MYKYRAIADTKVELELIEGDMGITKIWYRFLTLSGKKTKIIHGVQLDTNSKLGNLISRFLIGKIKSHERAEVLAIKKLAEGESKSTETDAPSVERQRVKYEKLFEVAKPYLERNDFGAAHTRRVLDIARRNFQVKKDNEELVYSAIVSHDIGGSSIEEQRERGPVIARQLLKKLGYSKQLIDEICEMIKTHHARLENPSKAFKILYDSDQLVKLSQEEFPHYNSNSNFDWGMVIDSMYSEKAKKLARRGLAARRKEFDKT